MLYAGFSQRSSFAASRFKRKTALGSGKLATNIPALNLRSKAQQKSDIGPQSACIRLQASPRAGLVYSIRNSSAGTSVAMEALLSRKLQQDQAGFSLSSILMVESERSVLILA